MMNYGAAPPTDKIDPIIAGWSTRYNSNDSYVLVDNSIHVSCDASATLTYGVSAYASSLVR